MVRVRENLSDWKMWEHGVPQSCLTVIKQAEDYIRPNGKHEAQWLCRCSCGSDKEVIATASDLKNGKVKSCGCMTKKFIRDVRFIDMTGWVMAEHGVLDSRLTVLYQIEDHITPQGVHEAMWLCECSCEEHNLIKTLGSSLRQGLTKSCGCLHKEVVSQIGQSNYKGNKYALLNEYGVLWLSNTNEQCYFSLNDANAILQHTWSKNNHGYAVARIGDNVFTMHRFLGYQWHDHHNRNKLDNRRENLVPCTIQENCSNISLPSNNTSGIIGVHWSTQMLKWVVQLQSNNVRMVLGYFDNKNDAIKTRLQAEAKYFGEFAPQRHLFEQYGINTKQNDLKKGD